MRYTYLCFQYNWKWNYFRQLQYHCIPETLQWHRQPRRSEGVSCRNCPVRLGHFLPPVIALHYRTSSTWRPGVAESHLATSSHYQPIRQW